MSLRHGDLVLGADVPQGLDIKLRGSDPAEPLTKGVVGVHHIPMASSVRNGNGALRSVVVPLGHLHERQGSEEEPKETSEHDALYISLHFARFWRV